jgi:hypothetical protein
VWTGVSAPHLKELSVHTVIPCLPWISSYARELSIKHSLCVVHPPLYSSQPPPPHSSHLNIHSCTHLTIPSQNLFIPPFIDSCLAHLAAAPSRPTATRWRSACPTRPSSSAPACRTARCERRRWRSAKGEEFARAHVVGRDEEGERVCRHLRA